MRDDLLLTEDARWQPRRVVRGLRCAECDATPVEPRPACARCGLVRCRLCPEPCAGCARLDRLRALCAGRAVDEGPGDPRGADKTFDLVLSLGDARDVLVDPRWVAVCSEGSRGFRERYFGWTGPGVLARLMRAMRLDTLPRPLVGVVRATALYSVEPKRFPPQLAWLLPLEHAVEIRFRPVPRGLELEAPQPIPESGPLALPPPVEVLPPEPGVAWIGHEHPISCPHCALAAERHRDGRDGWLVCAGCGRSFRGPR